MRQLLKERKQKGKATGTHTSPCKIHYAQFGQGFGGQGGISQEVSIKGAVHTPQILHRGLLLHRTLQLFYTERLVAEEKLHLMLYHHGIIQKATQEPDCKEWGLHWDQ